MKEGVLIAIDMQNDFIDGALGTPEAQAIVPNVVKKIEKAPSDGLYGKTDEDNLGFSYEILDKYVRTGEIENKEIKKKIDNLHINMTNDDLKEILYKELLYCSDYKKISNIIVKQIPKRMTWRIINKLIRIKENNEQIQSMKKKEKE